MVRGVKLARDAERIPITLGQRTPEDFHPGALAYALPYEGANLGVFHDRIAAPGNASMPHLLAHVLAHEITHAPQGVTRHSGEGIMRAQWTQQDFHPMIGKSLEFVSLDVDPIHREAREDAGCRQVNRILR